MSLQSDAEQSEAENAVVDPDNHTFMPDEPAMPAEPTLQGLQQHSHDSQATDSQQQAGQDEVCNPSIPKEESQAEIQIRLTDIKLPDLDAHGYKSAEHAAFSLPPFFPLDPLLVYPGPPMTHAYQRRLFFLNMLLHCLLALALWASGHSRSGPGLLCCICSQGLTCLTM